MTDFVAPQLGTIEDWTLNLNSGLLTVSGTLNSNPITTNRLTVLILNFDFNTGTYSAGVQVTDDQGTYQLGTPA